MMNLRTAKIFYYFLCRDFYTFKSRILTHVINNSLIYPVLYSLLFGYIQPNIYFGIHSQMQGSALFIGQILIILLVFANTVNIMVLFDLENTRFTEYQITLLPPRIFLIERIFFASLLTFMIAVPFFPVAKLVLRDSFITSNASWISAYIILYLGSLCCSAYTMFAACLIPSSRKLRTFWMRVNFPLLTFGGLFVPWIASLKLSKILGLVMLFDPLLYITEGLRAAILQNPDYLPVELCIGMLLAFSIFFTLLSWHFFKKKVDHI